MPTGRSGTLDDVDLGIVAQLRSDGRISVNELARRVGVSRSTAYQRLQALEESGVIVGYRAVVDPVALGLELSALILLDLEQGDWREVFSSLKMMPGVEYLAALSGSHDGAVVVRTPDLATLRDVVLERLLDTPGIRATQTAIVLQDLTVELTWSGAEVK